VTQGIRRGLDGQSTLELERGELLVPFGFNYQVAGRASVGKHVDTS